VKTDAVSVIFKYSGLMQPPTTLRHGVESSLLRYFSEQVKWRTKATLT